MLSACWTLGDSHGRESCGGVFNKVQDTGAHPLRTRVAQPCTLAQCESVGWQAKLIRTGVIRIVCASSQDQGFMSQSLEKFLKFSRSSNIGAAVLARIFCAFRQRAPDTAIMPSSGRQLWAGLDNWASGVNGLIAHIIRRHRC
jgi:hypothetical protein